MRLVIALTVSLIACTQQNPTQKTAVIERAPLKGIDTPVVQQKQPQDAVISYDSTIYSQYIPAEVMSLISQHLPQWHLPAPNNWDVFWFSEYKKDSALVNYISGDFNCDGKQDYCLLSESPNEGFAVWVFQSAKESYRAVKLEEFGHMEKPVEVGLRVTEAGQLSYLDENAEDIKTITLECPAISVLFFEKAAVTHYWKNGKYIEVQTGD